MSATPSAIAPDPTQVSILLVERDELSLRPSSRRAPRVGEEHEREESRDLAVIGRTRWSVRVRRIASPERALLLNRVFRRAEVVEPPDDPAELHPLAEEGGGVAHDIDERIAPLPQLVRDLLG
jgi:hypothetical protein